MWLFTTCSGPIYILLNSKWFINIYSVTAAEVVGWFNSWCRASSSPDGLYGSKNRPELTTAQFEQVCGV